MRGLGGAQDTEVVLLTDKRCLFSAVISSRAALPPSSGAVHANTHSSSKAQVGLCVFICIFSCSVRLFLLQQ